MSSESKAARNNQNPCTCTTDKALKHKEFSHKDARGTQEHTFTDNRKVICIKHRLGNDKAVLRSCVPPLAFSGLADASVFAERM